MNEEWDQRTEKILDLTLEIIHLLTGEGLMVVKKSSEHIEPIRRPPASDGSDRTHCLITARPSHSLVLEKKILELTHRILRLLTGEVPIRCEDIVVYFSTEEWEYVEGHKDFYSDVMMENNRPHGALEDGSMSGVFSVPISFSDCGAKNESATKTFTRRNHLLTCPCEKISQNTNPYIEGNHSNKESFASINCISTDYARADIKDESASRLGGNLPNSVPYTYQEQTQTESPSIHVKEDAFVCEGSLTDTLNHRDLEPTQIENTNNKGDITKVLVSLEENSSNSLQERRKCEKNINTESGKSSRHAHYQEAQSNCSEHLESIRRNRKAGSEGVFDNSDPGVHEVTPRQEKQFQCFECGKSFRLKRYLSQHRRIHTGSLPYNCSECGKRFMHRSSYVTHQRVHTGEKPFECAECGKCFTRDTGLAYHKTIHTGKKPFKCTECGKCFPIKHIFRKHQKIHLIEKPFSCPKCGKGFSNERNLTGHQSVHTGEKPYKCSECGKCFRLKQILMLHQMIHTGEKPFMCSECGKCFKVKHALTVHQRVHTGEKPFVCDKCGKCFNCKSNHVKHRKTHVREKNV